MIDQRRLPAAEESTSPAGPGRRWPRLSAPWSSAGRRPSASPRPWAWRSRPAAADVSLSASTGAGSVEAEDGRFRRRLQAATKGLFATRPTAVNLAWALDEMERIWTRDGSVPGGGGGAMRLRALEIYRDDVAACRRIGRYGADLIDAWVAVRPAAPSAGGSGHPDPLQRRGPGDGRLRHGAGGDPRRLRAAPRRARLRRRDAALPAGGAADGLGTAARGHLGRAHHRQHGRALP